MIRIMYIVHSFGIGGLEKCVVDLVNGLDRNYFEPSICVLTSNGESAKKLTAPCEIHEMRKKSGNDIRLPFRLSALFRRQHIDVIQSANWGTFLESLLGAKMARVPVSIHMKQGMEMEEFFDHDANGKMLKITTQRIFADKYNKLVAVSKEIKEHYSTKLGVSEKIIQVIPNSVDIDAYRPDEGLRNIKRTELGINDETVLVGSVGRLSKVKNYLSLIKAMRKVADSGLKVKLVLIGAGPERESLKKEIKKLDLEYHISLLGQRFDTPELLNAFDIFVLPSFSEGISFSILEAMATAKLVIASNVGGNPELVAPKTTGELYQSDDSSALSNLILKYAHNVDLRQKMGNSARQFVEQSFGLSSMVDRYCDLYKTELKLAQP